MPKKDARAAHAPPHTGPESEEPFSRPFLIDRLHTDGATDITITADAAERLALADLDGLERVDRLEGRFRIERLGSGLRVTGEVEADIVQRCVVTLEPFPSRLREPVDVRYAPEAEVAELEAASARGGSDVFEDVADADEVPDPIVDGRIDLGTLAAEFLALGLDPYPRKPGAAFEATASGGEADTVSPFAALKTRGETE